MIKNVLLVSLCLLLSTYSSNAIEIDSTLELKYQEGYMKVENIIKEENLVDSTCGFPYCAYIMGNFWSINVLHNDKAYLYYGTFMPKKRSKLEIHNEKAGLDIFSLLHLKIDDDKRITNRRYFPYQHYLLICDSYHNKIFEWDNFTIYVGDSKNIKNIEKIQAEYIMFIIEKCMH